jgi:hypothetical protein
MFEVSTNFTHYEGGRLDYVIPIDIEDRKHGMKLAPD